MDATRFDGLARRLGTRRTAVGGLLGGLAALAGLDTDARKKKRNGNHAQAKKKHDRGDANAKSKQQDGVHADKKKKKKKKCKAGAIKCGKTCVTAATDAMNCGGCGNRCGAGVACVSGVCASDSACPAPQLSCGDLCVDPSSNEQHCGGCGRACTGDLTCLNGTCGCADGSETKCGDLCVNLQNDNRHCGGCGAVCGSGTSCVGGACVQPPECSSDFDCGAGSGDLTCRNRRCVCKTDGEGICYRYPGRAGLAGECNPCCTGGNGICLRDHVCRNDLGTTFGGVPFPICSCPAGTVTCPFGESFRCTQNQATDLNRCGMNCQDCALLGPTSFCCFGQCLTACEPNTACNLQTCGGCQTCGTGSACCRSGTSNLFGCALLVSGRCPGPAQS